VTGVNWLRDSAAGDLNGDLTVDTDRIIVGGGSAGAITSLFVGTAHNTSTSTVPPVGNAALVPGVEVAGILDMAGGLGGFERLVDPADPATYIVHGRQDGVLPHEQATDLAAALTAAGVPFGFPLINGGHGHYEDKLNTDLGNGYLVSDDMFTFFNDQLELQDLVVPEPSSITLLAAVAVGGLTLRRRRSPVVCFGTTKSRCDTEFQPKENYYDLV
jgi:acetyl esterase/lipase